MNHFDYQDGVLFAEGVSIPRIAADVGTPFYCYSTATIERHYTVLAESLAAAGLKATICFACKANPNLAVIRTLSRLGAGADVVSEGELRRALAAGVPAERIVFSGVGKTRDELAFAIESGIMQINVESEPELLMLSELATAAGREIEVAIRVNPDVDANTHAKITTGKKENKFGIEWTRVREVYAIARALPGLVPVAVACHIGSQLTEIGPFREAFLRLRDLVQVLRSDGTDIRRLDLGGGLGVPYDGETPPSPAAYAGAIAETLGDLGCSVLVEPGRLLVGNAGLLVSSVVRVKTGATRTFVVVDAAMNDLMRPALYDAYHAIHPVTEPSAEVEAVPVDIVGPVCETGDTFARQRPLPPVQAGDLLVFATAGAYGAAMASTYNSRPLVPEVMVNGNRFAVVRVRPSYEEMIAFDRLPDWQSDTKTGQ
ncbi:diaminopimelate decarboxylase [Magnetospirillum molischianum]|uniref:Diaminopimelate decarboxylase n=1 Tax=Magnetospirillum molischianum DSM 120 TaxID=1150626 RepID=H8FTN2_MAGML|nr:diaminopimelate decarboxylase [Magnetospirillum molischianum]CCG41739.1 diaminopimelate decarboxylase [Magnetospirillum molischianum DSM 120]